MNIIGKSWLQESHIRLIRMKKWNEVHVGASVSQETVGDYKWCTESQKEDSRRKKI